MSAPATTVRSGRSLFRLQRFDRVERTAHWLVAVLFGALMVTALALYFGSIFGVVLPRHTVAQIHLWCGLALPIPVIASLAGRWGRGMRADLRRVSAWTPEEVRSLTGRAPAHLDADKFNPGQKLNTIFIGASILIMLVTGSMLQWFRFFPVVLRTNATFVHDVFSLAIFVVVIGHVLMALTHPEALKSMVSGSISEGWAARHAPRWLREQTESRSASTRKK